MARVAAPAECAVLWQDLWMLDDRHHLPLTDPSYRRSLVRAAARLLGPAEAEDAVQETMVRAWKSIDRFEGRSSLRSWLYRIATNVCLDMTRSAGRRALPMDLGPAGAPTLEMLGQARPDRTWVLPVPNDALDPAEVVVGREHVRLAFIAALQYLPPRQRAVLVLCEVLRWSAAEVAALLDTSTASVNSALQRARATLSALPPSEPTELTPDLAGLLARYVAAFERYDVEALVRLLREDAVMDMPPYPLWLRGPADIAAWLLGPGNECRGSRLLPTSANGGPAFGQYRPNPAGGHLPWALVVLDVSGDQIVGLSNFLDTANLFPAFGLPPQLTSG